MNVQDDRVGAQPVGQGQGHLRVSGDDGLEPMLLRPRPQETRDVAVLLQDQQHPILRPATVPFIAHRAGQKGRPAAISALRGRDRGGPAAPRCVHKLFHRARSGRRLVDKRGRRLVDKREVQGEGTALIGLAGHRQLTAQQVGNLATNR